MTSLHVDTLHPGNGVGGSVLAGSPLIERLQAESHNRNSRGSFVGSRRGSLRSGVWAGDERHQSIALEVVEFKDEKIPIGTSKILKGNFESLDYDQCENDLLVNEAEKKGYQWEVRKEIFRWVISVFIGVLTGLIAVTVNIVIKLLSGYKYEMLQGYLDSCLDTSCMWKPGLFWFGFNLAGILPGVLLVTYVEPVAMGSGIPQVKAYLNGIKIPHLLRFKTLVVKAVGVVSSVVGGLAAGKEGPMIHSGSAVAAGFSQGKSSLFDFINVKWFSKFRDDREKRDFISGGAAAGVAAAFGAPIGGVLFSLEEGASFWNQTLTWRIFFTSTISSFTLNACMSWYEGHPGNMTYDGLWNFGSFANLNYELTELPIFVVMGAIGGVLGAFYNFANHKITVFRMRYVRAKWLKVLEVMLVAIVTALVALVMIYGIDECVALDEDNAPSYPIQLHCALGEYNPFASLWIQLPETSVSSFFHDDDGTHAIATLTPFVIVYYLLSIWTYGLSMSAGLFIPCLLVGAAWGRMIGIALENNVPLTPMLYIANPGKFALVGAAAQLGGVVRMTISLTVILVEATGSIIFGLPLMITLFTAKWVGDFFNEGIYDIHTHLMGMPLLAWEPPPLSFNMIAGVFMNHPVVTLGPVESVRKIVRVLRAKSYNGFPIVVTRGNGVDTYGRLNGLILRSQLIVLLQNKIFNMNMDGWDNSIINMKMYRTFYPTFPRISDIVLTEEEMNRSIDLTPFMNPSPYCVQMSFSLTKVFRLFRALGLRHLVVTNDVNEVVGMVTRKDLAKYRVWKHYGKCGVQELKIVCV